MALEINIANTSQAVNNSKIKCHHRHSNLCDLWNMLSYMLVCILASPLLADVTATCYFPLDLQGEFVTQNAVNHVKEVIYYRINITEDSIPIWGQCYLRNGSNVILKIDSDDSTCYRCFSLRLVSRNILQVHTTDEDYISKCYTNETAAIISCPNPDTLHDNNQHKEIILYKTTEADGNDIQRQYCPFNGRYKVSYSIDDGSSDPIACDGEDSEIDNCPSNSAINIRFRKCTFDNYETTLECLGSWSGYDGQQFVAFFNKDNGYFGPQYRCATYNRNAKTGIVTISFNPGSMCSTEQTYEQQDHDHIQTVRRETLTLYPADDNLLWSNANQYCNIPKWMHGEYEHLSINAKQIVYRDRASFKTYTMECVHLRDNVAVNANQRTARMLTFSRTQCGEEQYHCVWLGQRSTNILEFQVGSKTIQHNSFIDKHDIDIESICDDQYFGEHWATQSRIDAEYKVTSCPIDGEFVGQLPDRLDFCARLWSDCMRPDIMYYQISHCEYGEVYEERAYQCIGQWSEGNVMYAYTRRVDVPVHECFAGAMDVNEKIFLKEAGEDCRRNADPYRYGMQMNQTISCAKLLNHHPPSAFDINTATTIDGNEDKTRFDPSYQPNQPYKPFVNGIDHIPTDPLNINSNYSHNNDSVMIVVNRNISEMARPSIGIGYDYFDENRLNVGSSTESRFDENNGRFNETVQFVNIKKVNSYENNDVVDNESDVSDLRATTHHSTDSKRPYPTTTTPTLSKYDTPPIDYNRSASILLSWPLLMMCGFFILM